MVVTLSTRGNNRTSSLVTPSVTPSSMHLASATAVAMTPPYVSVNCSSKRTTYPQSSYSDTPLAATPSGGLLETVVYAGHSATMVTPVYEGFGRNTRHIAECWLWCT